MRRAAVLALLSAALVPLTSCTRSHPEDPHTLVMTIESAPLNLDPRLGTDAQSERIDELLFDALVHRDPHFNLQPELATSWEIPDPLTYIFHLRHGVRFHDGRPLTARDVKWTLDSLTSGALPGPKASTYQYLSDVEAPDDFTVIFHLRQPDAALLWNLSDGALGVVPYGSGADFGRHPIGSGPFRFVSLAPDKQVIIARNPGYWDPARLPRVEQVRFAIVPDDTTRALELRKGSADLEINSLPPDMVFAMQRDPALAIERSPGTIYQYLAFNLRDPILKNLAVRQAIACAIARGQIIHFLWRDQAVPASSILPPQSWAFAASATPYRFDPARARALLDQAGYRAAPNGIRFHLLMKISSSQESTRLLAAVLQQQLRAVGIALDLRTLEFATFYSDVTRGAFQLYSLRWIGANQDPDIFEDVFASSSFPPRRANRGYYSNPAADALIAQGRVSTGQAQRARIYAQLQQILARDLPYVNLWYLDNVLVHTRRVQNLPLSPSGDYDFLTQATITR